MSSQEEYFVCWHASPEAMDGLWAEGWRHFGGVFFRYRRWQHGGRWLTVTPLRIDLERFAPSRSQRRVLARNGDLRVETRPTEVVAELRRMFRRHRLRFREQVPESLDDFLSHAPATVPCRNETICVYSGSRLVAAHFLDVGGDASSSVYSMFDPDESRRSLGVYTMLLAAARAGPGPAPLLPRLRHARALALRLQEELRRPRRVRLARPLAPARRAGLKGPVLLR